MNSSQNSKNLLLNESSDAPKTKIKPKSKDSIKHKS